MAKRRKERPDPIADYVEWTNNRYNPGYYLGGNIPPYLRKSSLGPKGRRLAGVLLGIFAVLATGSTVSSLFWGADYSRLQLGGSVAVAALIWWAAVTMFRSTHPPPKVPSSRKLPSDPPATS